MPTLEAICCSLPNKKVGNNFFYNYHDKKYIQNTSNIIGVKNRYWATNESSLSLCISAAKNIFNSKYYKKIDIRNKIDLIVFITQTPERVSPGIAYSAHEVLNLNENCTCLSLNSGCSAFVEGVALIYDLMQSRKYKYALLLVGDVIGKHLDLSDTGTAPIFGDCGTASLIKNNSFNKYVYLSGTKPNSTSNIKLEFKKNNKKEFLKMNGMDVFVFTVNGIPKYIEKISNEWKKKYKENPKIRWYLLHQANKMILEHIAKKLQIPLCKMPINISDYGNTSGSSIPLLICDLFNHDYKTKFSNVLLCGFGVGLTWSVLLTNSIRLKYCNLIKTKVNE